MSDLIGRFLSFEEHLGRGLVKFAYYLALFFIIITNLWWLLSDIFSLEIGHAVIVLCQALLWIVVLRVVTELALAILSIDDHLQNGALINEGFEAGITPSRGTTRADTPQEPKTVSDPTPSSEDDTSPKED